MLDNSKMISYTISLTVSLCSYLYVCGNTLYIRMYKGTYSNQVRIETKWGYQGYPGYTLHGSHLDCKTSEISTDCTIEVF